MKKILTIALFATSLAVSAQAVIVGFEAGYLTDSKEAYLAARAGYEVKGNASLSHQLEVEIGFTELSETMSLGLSPTSTVTAKMKITPLTLNYRAELVGTGKLGYYLGAGVGLARVSLSVAGSGVPSMSDSDNSLALQGFAGVTYQASAAAKLHLGLKYVWFGDAELFGISDKVGDDLAVMAAVSFKF